MDTAREKAATVPDIRNRAVARKIDMIAKIRQLLVFMAGVKKST
jgi:hypothetical protein